ncbi:hypothetical protein [Pareuzebyella sediminis]|uniref:hypothetical protein n=1 Tax=Pareuzebyella sediminis TaxID=2607998 RepID=UPI0011F029CA|nr:hypothetical protein [Pareuzebyella sediminis]
MFKTRLPALSVLVFFIATALFGISCKDQKNIDRIFKSTSNVTVKENKVNIEDYFPGPNFMKILRAENKSINLGQSQRDTLTKWHIENRSQVTTGLRQISALDHKIKYLSQEGASSEQILKQLEEREKVVRKIVVIEMNCRDLLRKTLNTLQWKKLICKYKEEHPFIERTEMMEVMSHVNPVPNYIQALKASIEKLNLSEWQRQKFDEWSDQHHSEMIKWAKNIIALEKEIYEKWFDNDPEEKLLGKFEDIQKLRTNIVTTKTACRNMVKHTLTQEQWGLLTTYTN